MLILSIVLKKPGIYVDKILHEFLSEQREEVYPLVAPVMLRGLIEELEAIDYLKIQKGKAYVTKEGEAKLGDFKASLTEEERKALAL